MGGKAQHCMALHGMAQHSMALYCMVWAGNTKGGSITVPLTSCLTGLEWAVWQLTIFVFICKPDHSKPVKQEVNGTVILPTLVFPGTGWVSVGSSSFLRLTEMFAMKGNLTWVTFYTLTDGIQRILKGWKNKKRQLFFSFFWCKEKERFEAIWMEHIFFLHHFSLLTFCFWNIFLTFCLRNSTVKVIKTFYCYN